MKKPIRPPAVFQHGELWRGMEIYKDLTWLFQMPMHRRVVAQHAFVTGRLEVYVVYMLYAWILAEMASDPYGKRGSYLLLYVLAERVFDEENKISDNQSDKPKKVIRDFLETKIAVTPDEVISALCSLRDAAGSLVKNAFEGEGDYAIALSNAYVIDESGDEKATLGTYRDTPLAKRLQLFRFAEWHPAGDAKPKSKQELEDYRSELQSLKRLNFPVDDILCGLVKLD